MMSRVRAAIMELRTGTDDRTVSHLNRPSFTERVVPATPRTPPETFFFPQPRTSRCPLGSPFESHQISEPRELLLSSIRYANSYR